ncbi:PREDICTED: protocadherin gamma-A7 [Myotis davidii]|uniref:protocadherin gamma-A7 n=1 Tax=Myotis davidii TaxID=225400 RepID=UPI000767D326|nr:PREDICTED: protocadherin gamma-A7 [Myotis davidii]
MICRTMAAPERGRNYRGFILLSILLGTRSEAWAGHILYSVPEETDKGSFVGNIAKNLGLEAQELAERGVRIVSRGRTQLFALNKRTGSLVTAGRIDREELCAQSARCLVSFNILIEDKMNLYPIEVEIMDVNDNAPRFLTEEMNVKIMENTAPGVRFPLKEARDPDVGTNSLQSYQLSPNRHFSLLVQTGEDGTKYPELVLERVLDREEEAIHHLLLTASDGGDPPLSGTARIQVVVLDVNDHAPVFSLPQYQVTVPENVPVGTRLLTVNAIDLDEGVNGEVTYSFWKITPKILQIFQLNSHTGELSTLESLDYEESSYYEMEVQAQDGPGSMTRAKVRVTILDVNDNAPEVTITSVSSSIPEDTPPGTVIALFYFQDRDSGKNGEVTCTISENLPFKLERSIDNYYRLVTAKHLDREILSVYNITLKTTDGGSPPLSTETHISIKVSDTNDNPPSFPHSAYSVYVPENNPRGASIFTVTAHDPDSDENARVTYSLDEDTIQGVPLSSYVSINPDTGVLYALHSFDYEQFRDLQLRVTAQDSGDPPLSSNVSLSLFVLDQNDNAPEILYPAIPTDGSTGVELAPRVAVADSIPDVLADLGSLEVPHDSEASGLTLYLVVAVAVVSCVFLAFVIILLALRLRRWSTSRMLQASGGGFTGEVSLTADSGKSHLIFPQPNYADTLISDDSCEKKDPFLAPIDFHECKDEAQSIRPLRYRIPEEMPEGSVVGNLAKDLGLSVRELPTRQLRVSSEKPHFTVSAERGDLLNYQLSPNDHFLLVNKEKSDGSKYPELVLKMPLDREEQKSYHLTLTAVDCGDPPLSSTAQIQVLVTDANDSPPVFSQELYRAGLPENVFPGTTVLRVMATDQDEGVNAEITFSFTEAGQTTPFDLNSTTGEITTRNTLDFEEVKEYSMVLEARDGGGMIAQCTVEIQVLDVNDNIPEVILQSLTDVIMEDTGLGTYIALLKVRDKDSGDNGEVTCKLEGEVPFKLLIYSRNTYKLVTDGVLDREQTPEYNVTITATDRGKPPLSSSTTITLRVTDVNDNAPVFQQPAYLVHVPENNPPPASIAQVSASDPDLGPNGQVSYAIVASDLEARALSSYVSVSAHSGVVFAQRAFDHEQLPPT